MEKAKPTPMTGDELYGQLEIDKADALVDRLDALDLNAEETIEIDAKEKMILFEMMRAATEVNMKGQTLLFSVFDRNFVMGQVKWGKNVFKLKSDES